MKRAPLALCLLMLAVPAFASQEPGAPASSPAATQATPAASTPADPPTPSAADTRLQLRTPDELIDALSRRLSLTDGQRAKIRPILIERQKKLLALRDDTSERPRQRVRKMQALNEDFDKRIRAVLDDDQKQKFTALEEQMREKRRDRSQQPALHRSTDQN